MCSLPPSTESTMTEATPKPTSERPGVSPWWRVGAIVVSVLLATELAGTVSMFEQFKAQVAHQQAQLKTAPQIRFIAVLLDAQQAPALLVTHDPTSGALQLQRLNAVKEGREDTMQLWALKVGAAPRSLGVLSSKLATLSLPAAADALQSFERLAISVEDKGGVPESNGPRLPYLFEGAVVQKAI